MQLLCWKRQNPSQDAKYPAPPRDYAPKERGCWPAECAQLFYSSSFRLPAHPSTALRRGGGRLPDKRSNVSIAYFASVSELSLRDKTRKCGGSWSWKTSEPQTQRPRVLARMKTTFRHRRRSNLCGSPHVLGLTDSDDALRQRRYSRLARSEGLRLHRAVAPVRGKGEAHDNGVIVLGPKQSDSCSPLEHQLLKLAWRS